MAERILNTADETATVTEALCRVQSDLEAVAKGGKAAKDVGGYSYRTIDDVLAAVHPSFARHGIVIAPVKVTPTVTPHDRPGWRTLALHIVYRVYGPAGDSIDVEAYGEAISNSATAAGIAQSYAFKTCVSQLLTLPTHDPHSDPETAVVPDPPEWWEIYGWESRREHDDLYKRLKKLLRELEDGQADLVRPQLTKAGVINDDGLFVSRIKRRQYDDAIAAVETRTEPF